MEWISIKDGLPKEGESVVAVDEEGQVQVAFIASDMGTTSPFWTYYDYLEWKNVTHWMPLPAPPQEKI